MTPLVRALGEWARDVRDPPRATPAPNAELSRAAITAYIRDGLGWPSWEDEGFPEGHRPDVSSYAGDGAFEWCGAFAAWCLRDVVPAAIRAKFMASTYRLDRGLKAWRVDPATVQAGDVVVMGDDAHAIGSHIALALGAAAAGYVPTVEGNAYGLTHSHEYAQGVVCNLRPLAGAYRVRFVYRPGDPQT